jgi:tRNA (guanine-N7-)-methyltransferase
MESMQAHRELIIEPVGVEVDMLPRPIDFSALFGNANPVEIEIGMGKGTFLVDEARARPNVNFLGVEWARWYWRYASDRLRRHGCLNVRAVRAEANYFLSEFIPDNSIAVLHIYFPDPWPKARHHKRRLVQAKFMPLVERVLAPGGRVQVVTDHRGYFEEHIEPAIRGSRLRIVEYARPGGAASGELVGTNFERKYALEQRAIHAIAAEKSA